MMHKILIAIVCWLLVSAQPVWAEKPAITNDEAVTQAFEQRLNDLQIEGQGRVIKILSDDNQGSRHQRFIIKLASGQTLLIAHNIDLAPKLKNLRIGDEVSFYGEYEWSEKGGTLHWTHRDPGGRHIDGWLKHNGRIYQ